jgi:hypothetical protein
VVGIARQLIGRDPVVYFGDAGVMIGGNGRGFHKDNTCRDVVEHDDWKTPYTLIRMAIYLEDHERHSGGLKVRRGSHRHADVTTGEIVDIPSRAGDIVAWFLTTTHSGHAARVRGLPLVHLPPRFEVRMPAALHVPEETLRMAAFLTFGTDDHHLRNYIAKHTNLATYPDNYMFKSWLFSYGGEDAVRRLAAAGVTFVKPIAEYGSLFGPEHTFPEGFVRTRPGRPDVYPAKGLEAAIRGVGSVLRRFGLA